MARVRRYRQRWLLGPMLVVAAAVEGAGALTYQALKPVPPPPPWSLTLDLGGVGEGTVVASVPGNPVPIARCPRTKETCKIDVPPNTWVTLVAVRGENMTFEGWSGCAGYTEDVLTCDLMMFRDRAVSLRFGKAPEEVQVALMPSNMADVHLPPMLAPKPVDKLEAEKLEDAPVQLALVRPPPPQPLAPPPPPPDQAKAPSPPAQPPPPNMRMVEVPDQNEVDKAPDDATHLSDKNRDVAEETAATETNLEKQMDGKAKMTAESDDTTSPEVGGPDDKIAELETTKSDWNEVDRTSDHSGKDDSAQGQVVGDSGESGDEGTGGDRNPGVLAMRGIDGRGKLLDTKHGDGKRTGKHGAPGLERQLDLDDYERIVGKDVAEKERIVARAKMSAKKGRWERKIDAIKSSLENFTPDVRPGNQTALKTRAQPFAVYIARMHRRIHELWGFGFLEDLDGKPSSNPLNDFDLYTVIEIALNPDGTVYKTTIAKTSGKLEFDVAAIDTVLSAAPYEEPPEKIRSVDGRVYMRWGFYRNWRQCGTFNVEPYILTDIPGGAQPIDDGAALAAAGGHRPGGAARRGDKPVTPAPTAGDDPAPAPAPVSNDRAASYAANMWVAGFASASTSRMVRVSAVPFTAGGAVAASTQKELDEAYTHLLEESGPLRDWKLVSPAEFTRRTGVPTQGGDGDLVIAVTAGKETFGVVLTPTRSGEYRATEILR